MTPLSLSPQKVFPQSQATPQIQDPVIDEQPSAEETISIPYASASKSIPGGSGHVAQG